MMNTTGNAPVTDSTSAPKTDSKLSSLNQTIKKVSFLKHKSVWLISALLLTGVCITIYFISFGKSKVKYNTATVVRGDIESTVVAAGIVQPFKYVDVGAQTSGKLKSLRVNKGDQVEKNQLLAEIDPVLSQTAIMSANATLENMMAQRTLKEAQLVLATLQKNRNDELFANKAIAASERDITQADYEIAVADAASLSAQIKQATAAVNTAKANLGYTQITAPISGEIVSISFLEGQTLNANQQAPNILRIADISKVTVWAQVSEADIVRVVSGQDVYFTVLGSPRRWNGKIRKILPTPELINNVVFYDVLFDIPNQQRELKIQMTAQVFIVLAQAKNVLLVPVASIGNAAEGSQVKIRLLKPDNTIEIRTITIGIKSEISAEVKSGINENENIVIAEIVAPANKKSVLTTRKTP